MTNNTDKKTNPLPKMPAMNFGGGHPSMFSGGKSFGPKIANRGKFNQATFHTQHKGGTAGGGK